MPTPMDAMLGLVVLAIGFLMIIAAFQIADSKKRVISYALSGLVSLAGCYYFVSSEFRVIQMRRRIANIQRQQQVNLDEIQKRLRETQTQEKSPAPVKK